MAQDVMIHVETSVECVAQKDKETNMYVASWYPDYNIYVITLWLEVILVFSLILPSTLKVITLFA